MLPLVISYRIREAEKKNKTLKCRTKRVRSNHSLIDQLNSEGRISGHSSLNRDAISERPGPELNYFTIFRGGGCDKSHGFFLGTGQAYFGNLENEEICNVSVQPNQKSFSFIL